MLAQEYNKKRLEEFKSQSFESENKNENKMKNKIREHSPLYHTNMYEGYDEISEEWDEWCILAFDGDCTDVHYEIGEQLLAQYWGYA